jgi:hypothetical protein
MGNGLSLYLTKLARLGVYPARAKDPPPRNTVMWRGLTRLTDIQLGFILEPNLWVIERLIARLRSRNAEWETDPLESRDEIGTGKVGEFSDRCPQRFVGSHLTENLAWRHVPRL